MYIYQIQGFKKKLLILNMVSLVELSETVHVGGGTYYHILVQGLLSRVLFSSHILLVSALIITTKGGKYIITGIIVCQYCQLAEFSAD